MDDASTTVADIDPPTLAASRAARRSATINIAAKTVTVDGTEYSTENLPVNALAYCALRGLGMRLLAAEDPATAYAELRDGKTPADRSGKPKELDPWRKAYALAVADKMAKEQGVKAKSPEFADVMVDAEARAEAMDRTALAKAKRIPAVVAHWAKLTGAEVGL